MDSYLQTDPPNIRRVGLTEDAPSAVPVEGYLDDSFIDRTSPRLKGTPLTGAGLGEKPIPKNYVPARGAVIPEIVTRQRVIGPSGRDHGAVVSVIVPAGPAFAWQEEKPIDKTVATMEVHRGQASAIADMLAETISAMAFENDLMVPEGSEGIPVDPNNPLGGRLGGIDLFGRFFAAEPALSPQGFADTMQAFASSSLDPMETVTQALELVIQQLPEGAKKEKAKASMQPLKDVLKKAMGDIDALFKEVTTPPEATGTDTILKDEAFDTQGAAVLDGQVTGQAPSEWGQARDAVLRHCGWHGFSGFSFGLDQLGYQAHPESVFGTSCRSEDPLMWHWYLQQKQSNFAQAIEKIDLMLTEPMTDAQRLDRTSFREALIKLRDEGEQPMKEPSYPRPQNNGSV